MNRTWLEPVILSLYIILITFVLGSVILGVYGQDTAPLHTHTICEYPVDEVTAYYILDQLAR